MVARRSRCVRDSVGAVIVDARNRIVATGYNGPAEGYDPPLSEMDEYCAWWCPHSRESDDPCVAVHAEANALLVGDRSTREGGTIYATSDVCWPCGLLIANSGLTRVVVARTTRSDWRMPERTYEHLTTCGLEVVIVGS